MDDPQITKKGPWARFLECVQKVNAVGAAFLGLAAIVGGMWGAWFWFWPNISITSGTVASNVSPLETEYNIKNIGNISLYDVVLSCEISTPEVSHFYVSGIVADLPGLSMSQYIPLLVPGGVASRNCGGYPLLANPRMKYPATMLIWATAKWPWPYPLLNYLKYENFKGIKDADGHIQISPNVP
jgi:hypothetical protein